MDPTENDATQHAGITFGQRYRAIRVIGEGAFGCVYEGYDQNLQRKVAIKFAKPHTRKATQDRIQANLDEAHHLAKLQHPGIVSVFDVGVHDDHVYIVTELLHGPTLHDYIRVHLIDPIEAATLIANLATALAHAHSQLVIHRDVKPGNVIMTKERGPVLVDFGLAIADDNDGSQIGTAMGTVQYMAPEQVNGQAHRIDGRTDIYALGVLMYQLLTKRVPFRSSDKREIRRQILEDDPQPLRQLAPDVPDALQQICQRAMSRHISKRYATAQDLADRLKQFVDSGESSGISRDFRSEGDSDDSGSTLAHPSIVLSQDEAERRDEERDSNTVISRQGDHAEHGQAGSGSQGSVSSASGRRHVTVLRINAVPQRRESARIDPEDQLEVLDRLQRAVMESTESYGGSVLYRGGQEFTVCFGYPLSYEDAPRRATDMAMDIRDQFRTPQELVRAGRDIHLDLWLSVHSGMIVVMGNGEKTLVGDVLTLVAKLDRYTQPNEVIVSDDTLRLIGHHFVSEQLPVTCALREDEPQKLYRICRRRPVSAMDASSDFVQKTPLVGRDQEVSMLIDRWERTSEGIGQSVALIGEAGLGKSRLIQIIKQYVTQQVHAKQVSSRLPTPILEWQCSPYHSSSAFQPVKESIVRWLNLDPDSKAEDRRRHVAQHLQSIGMSPRETLPIFLELLSLPADPEWGSPKIPSSKMKELTIEAVLSWIMRLARQQPLLFIIEDLHWIDPSTLEILSHLADRPLDSPCLCLQTFRPEFTTPWTSRAHQSQIALNRLTRSQATQIIRSRMGDQTISKGTLARIIERTDGIPLFVEEYAKMLSEMGIASDCSTEDSHGSSLLTVRSSEEIPASLQDLLTARLDRAGGDHAFVRLAATIGREFSYEMIRAVSRFDEAVLTRELDILVDAEILYRRGSVPDCIFQFKHALIQDAAYEAMLRRQRQEFHQRIADVMVRQFPDMAHQRPEVLALHFTHAGLDQEAVIWWEVAGSTAVASGAFSEAIEQLQAGLELLERLPESISRDQLELKMNISLGIAILSTRGYASLDLEPLYDRRSELCKHLDDPMARLHALWAKGSWRIVRDDVIPCIAIGQEMKRLSDQMSDDGACAEALFMDAIGRFYHAEFATSLQLTQAGMEFYDAEQAMFHLRQTGQHAGVAHLCYMALNQWYRGQPKSAVESMRRGLQLAESLDHPFSVAFALHHHAWLSVLMGRGDEAVRMADRQIEVSQQQAFFFWETTGMLFRAGGMLCVGHTEVANNILTEAIDRYQQTGARLALPLYMSFVARGKRQMGDFAAADEAVCRGLEAAECFEDIFAASELWRQKALLAGSQGEMRQAAEYLLESVAVARRYQAVSDELISWLTMQSWMQKPEVKSTFESAAISCSIESVRRAIATLWEQMEIVDFSIPTLSNSLGRRSDATSNVPHASEPT